jgi:uncharacterized membrane protein
MVTSSAALFTAALLVRLVVVSQIVPHMQDTEYLDFNEPTRVAWALVSGHGFSSPWRDSPLLPTAVLPPLYPLLIAAIFKVAGAYSAASLWMASSLNALFSACTAVLILKLGVRTLGRAAGILGAWVWAISPYEAVVSARIWESALSGLLLVVILWLSLSLRDTESNSRWLLCGLLGGICALNNPALLPVFGLVVIWCWLPHARRSSVRGLALCLLACVLTAVPWTVRNYLTFHRLIPVRDNFGLELWQGNHQDPGDFTDFTQLGEIGFMDARRRAALDFIAANPGEFLRRSGVRFFRFWSNPQGSIWFLASGLAWLGAVLVLYRKREAAVPLVIALLAFPLVYYITHPGVTYRHPIEPEILLLGSYAVVTASTWVYRSAAHFRRRISD